MSGDIPEGEERVSKYIVERKCKNSFSAKVKIAGEEYRVGDFLAY